MKLDPQVLEGLLIWQASDLARRKKYSEAEAILGLLETSEGKNRSAACDLLGKIKAKQGQYAEAKAYFQKAIAFDPGNSSPREALDNLPNYQRKRRALKLASFASPFLALVIGILAFYWLVPLKNGALYLQKNRAGSPEIVIPDKSLSRGPEKTQFQDEIRWPAIDPSGLTVTQSPSEMTIVFDKGVFANRCELTADGKRLIKAVAEKIKQTTGTLFVIIEGHTDNLPVYDGSPYRDNLHLGLSRAETILSIFHSEHGLPKSKLLGVSAGEKAPLYPNDSEETMRKNRTVSIRILPIRQ
jgi:flagellar motor protein MotB